MGAWQMPLHMPPQALPPFLPWGQGRRRAQGNHGPPPAAGA